MPRKQLGRAAASPNDLLRLADLLALYTSGSNSNGIWRQRPDGQIDQSGAVTLSAGTATITFPLPFPNACEALMLTARTGSTAAQDVAVYQTAAPGKSTAAIGGSVTTVGLNAGIAAASFVVAWRAVGT